MILRSRRWKQQRGVAECVFAAISSAAHAGRASPDGAQAATPVVVTTAASAVIIENHTGRPLLNVRVAVDAAGPSSPFITIVPTIDTDQTMTLQLSDFRTDEAVMFDPGPCRRRLAKSYEATASCENA